jgi:hypothetical protein
MAAITDPIAAITGSKTAAGGDLMFKDPPKSGKIMPKNFEKRKSITGNRKNRR